MKIESSMIAGQTGICGCNHTQPLALSSKKVWLKDINVAFSHPASMIGIAGCPTEEFDPPIGRLASERSISEDRADSYSSSYLAW